VDSAEVSDLSYNDFSPITNRDPTIVAAWGEDADLGVVSAWLWEWR
jgi:hypothetical protein